MGEGAERIAEVAVPILAVMICGWLSVHFQLFREEAIWMFNTFVFTFGIPALVFKGLAQQDLPSLDWDVALVFLILRIIFGFIMALYTLVVRSFDYPGEFVFNYIGTTWINTIIFGIPMLASLYGPAVAVLNVLAAISSLIFQLPLMLAILEFRKVWYPSEIVRLKDIRGPLEKDVETGTSVEGKDQTDSQAKKASRKLDTVVVARNSSASVPQGEQPGSQQQLELTSKINLEEAEKGSLQEKQLSTVDKLDDVAMHKSTLSTVSQVRPKTPWEIMRDITLRVFTAPPMIGIILGILYSLIVVSGADYTDFAEPKPSGFGLYLNNFVDFFGVTVTPLATFTIGMLSYGRFHHFTHHLVRNIIFIVIKMLLMPMLAIPLCMALDIDGIKGRSAVLIASLPIALASFSLTRNYYRQEDVIAVISAQVIIGAIIMVGTFTAWNEFMNAVDLFGEIPDDAMFKPPKKK
eukprot:CAMPEP_0170178864 /NCGR_PEP_ID=MMETSP0040_2-20121228/14723_1 /TAXON_ID=641309 /ORGANISM="Lotharella oceanica, Strain CCMP622" /LENGTH=463 /DNA_ID=CAMNT_0010422467 /DNA_START=137 /DNA_END=1528 /DNA_ORIENTATION=-